MLAPAHDGPLSVVTDELDMNGTLRSPNEADPKLIIDTDVVLARSIACQRLRTDTRRHPKIVELLRALELFQLASGYRLDVPEPLYSLATEQLLGVPASK